jgi:hypothetical protein
MKKIPAAVIFLCAVLPLFSQKLSSVVIFPFDAPGPGVSANDAASIRKQIIDEVLSWESIIVLDEANVESADFYVRGTVIMDGNMIALTGTTFNAKTGRPINSYREQAATISGLSAQIFSFCSLMAEAIPFPNFLLGKWTSTVDMNDGPLTCIVEFKANRTVMVERYDTYEHRQDNALTYQGFGSGTYSFRPQIRRMVTVQDSRGASRNSPVDGEVNVNLSLEDVLPQYTALNVNRTRLVFSNQNNDLELLTAGFPCGENADGTAVYPERTVVYTRFTRIQ